MNTTINFSDEVTTGEYFFIPGLEEDGATAQGDGYYCANVLSDLLKFIQSENMNVWKNQIHYANCDDLSTVVHTL